MDWTIVRPPRLTDGAAQGYQVNPQQLSFAASLPRADLARFLVDQLETREHVRASPLVAALPASARKLIPAAPAAA
jgi:hypothetical protein